MPDQEFADCVAATCYEHYATKLGKAGKPKSGNEWTLLAAILSTSGRQLGLGDTSPADQRLRVVSMATGSKCISKSKMCPKGSILNDSHAEVLARRAFIRYLHQQLHLAIRGGDDDDDNGLEVLEKSTIETSSELKFRVKPGIEFHLFSSHVPCGDAAIFPKRESSNHPSKMKRLRRSSLTSTADEDDEDVYRTGAKCVVGGSQDPLEDGAAYHVVGALRTKPGRGDRTLSMSCSDKMAKWNVLGLQGTLLMRFLVQPIYLTSIVIGRCSYSEAALRRAVIDRVAPITGLPFGYRKNLPQLFQSHSKFVDAKSGDEKMLPAPASIVWCDVPQRCQETIVDGYKQGTTKKNRGTPQSRCAISKYELFASFLTLLELILDDDTTSSDSTVNINDPLTYEQHKNSSEASYSSAKQAFLTVFDQWTIKPKELVQFKAND